MLTWQENKYKDDNPIDTINRIRHILGDMGIVPIEKYWNNSAKGYHSVTLTIPKTSLKCNGKGTSHIFSLASAYAELMERLQNFAPFRLGMDFRDEAHGDCGFYYAPDEKRIDIEDWLYSKEEWLLEQEKYIDDESNILKLWKEVSYEEINSDFIGIPYQNLMTKNLSYIPIKMVNKMYMSNGMAAGNTQEEALVQGLSELFERYVNKQIIEGKITPPSIPKSYLYQFKPIANMIESIEKSGPFTVIVKDCSLGEGYPVISVIFIDKQTNSYFIKFGSFPKFDVAVERTLTELLQGQDVRKMKGLRNYTYNCTLQDEHSNIIGILVNGIGEYPKEYFETDYSYEWQPWDCFDARNNKDLLRQVLKFIENKGYSVYARDVSFLGFPSYHVLIPNFSEVEHINDSSSVAKYSKYNKIKRYIRNFATLRERDLDHLLTLINEEGFHPMASIMNLINIDVDSKIPWYLTNIALLKLALYCRLGKYEDGYYALKEYTDNYKEMNNKYPISPYYKCLEQYLMMKKDGKEDIYIFETLSNFYESALIDHVIMDFAPDSIIDKSKNILNCFECHQCQIKENCTYVETEKIYRLLKSKYKTFRVNQEDAFNKI